VSPGKRGKEVAALGLVSCVRLRALRGKD
jgi:hypothetical protein